MGGAQGRDAGVPRSAWLCWRFDGRRGHDHRRRREPAGARLALLDRPWRRPAVRAQGGQATFHPRANGPVVARPRRDADRRRPGRKPDGLPPPARSDRATRRDGKGAAHPAAVCCGDGGDARARSLEGLVNGNPAPIAATVSLGQRLHRVRVIMDQLETSDKDLPLRNASVKPSWSLRSETKSNESLVAWWQGRKSCNLCGQVARDRRVLLVCLATNRFKPSLVRDSAA